MTNFLRHESCPRCGSKDNLGVWEDGHKWCFGCHYYESGDGNLNQEILLKRIKYNNDKITSKVSLPNDFDYSIPPAALDWLAKYDLTKQEIIANHIGYSEEHQRLIFPVFSETGEVLMWIGRAFGDKHTSKYYIKGDVKGVLHILGYGKILVLTEDLVSAIKVSRVTAAMPVFGSHVSNYTLLKTSRFFKELAIWLDRDKAAEAVKAAQRARLFFDVVSVVITDKDPKEYGVKEIRRYLKYDGFNNSKDST